MVVYNENPLWRENSYLDKADVIDAARSFEILNGNSRAVLLLHGYAGYPGEMVHPALQLVEKGFDIYAPRLPGMGTSGKDFINTSYKDWLTFSLNVYKDLVKKYESVDIVAHSMGTLLAILIASEIKVNKLVLIAPAVKVPKALPSLINIMSLFIKEKSLSWQSNNEYNLHYENAPKDDEFLGKEYWSHLYFKQLKSLLKLQKMTKAKIKDIKSNILAITCEKDSITDYKACDVFLKNKGMSKVVNIKNATHYVLYDINPESEAEAIKLCIEFLTQD